MSTDPEGTLAQARSNLDALRERHRRGQVAKWLGEWPELLDGPIEDMLTALTSPSPRSRTAPELVLRRSPQRCRAGTHPRRLHCELHLRLAVGCRVRRSEPAHILCAASRIADDPDVVVIGSRSILGTYDEDDLPDPVVGSLEADITF